MTELIREQLRGRVWQTFGVICERCRTQATFPAADAADVPAQLRCLGWQQDSAGRWHCPACPPERQLSLEEAR